MVRFTVCVTAVCTNKAQQLQQAFSYLAKNARFEPGYQAASARLDGDSSVQYEETWATEPDLMRRVRSEAFRSVLEVMESSSGEPSIQFHLAITTRGLEYVEHVRRSGST